MTKPDFGLMLEQARKNEVGLRLALGAWGGVKGTLPLQLVQLHNQTVEVILALEMYGRELEDDEEEED